MKWIGETWSNSQKLKQKIPIITDRDFLLLELLLNNSCENLVKVLGFFVVYRNN